MAIQGSLREAALPDVIQLLHLGRRTGCLAVADRQRHASVYFEDGWVVHASIVNRRDRLGDMLVKTGLVQTAALEQAVAMQARAPGQRLGDLLCALGAISREDLARAIHRQVEEAVYTLFTWSTGTFRFDPDARPDEGTECVRIAPDALLLEGARRVDEWSLIEQRIPGFDLVFGLSSDGPDTSALDFSPAQRRLLPLLDGTRDVRDLVDASGMTEFDACQALYGLITAGVVHRVGTSAPTEGRSLDTQIEEHRNLGVAFYRTGMLEEASREFRRVMELRPSEGAAPFHLGLIAAREDRWADAVYFFRRALDRAGPRPAILHNLGVALEQVGEPDQADATLNDALGRSPESGPLLLAWGLLALDRGDATVATVRLARAREVFGDQVPALWYFGAARAAALGGELERAVRYAAEGVERYPRSAVLLNNHAVLLEASGDLTMAEQVLTRALEEDPSLPQASKNLGDVAYRQGRYEEAWEAYQRAARLRPSLGDDLYFKLGNIALKQGESAEARRYWERALELNPRHQLARANLHSLAGAP